MKIKSLIGLPISFLKQGYSETVEEETKFENKTVCVIIKKPIYLLEMHILYVNKGFFRFKFRCEVSFFKIISDMKHSNSHQDLK